MSCKAEQERRGDTLHKRPRRGFFVILHKRPRRADAESLSPWDPASPHTHL